MRPAIVGLPAAILSSRAAQWTYEGCYVDSVSNRTFSHYANLQNTTVESCTDYCASNGYNFAGLEYGSECYCDYQLSGAAQEPDSDCSMPCAGNSSEICGNGNRLSVYSDGTGPETNQGPNGWTYLACYTDSQSARTLRNSQSVGSSMTVTGCVAACGSAGYSLAGVEYADECWCDNAIQDSASPANSGCNMPCQGNSSEYCGGSNRLNVYQGTAIAAGDNGPSGWQALGCYTDSQTNRTLESQQSVPGGYTNMTVEGCLSACGSAGYIYGGLEYSQECWCGNAVQNGGGCASDPSTCYQPCRGNTGEVCGGSDRLNLYYSGSDASVVACSVQGTSTSSSALTSKSTSISTSPVTTSSSALTSVVPPASTVTTSTSSSSSSSVPTTSSTSPSTTSTSISSSQPPASSTFTSSSAVQLTTSSTSTISSSTATTSSSSSSSATSSSAALTTSTSTTLTTSTTTKTSSTSSSTVCPTFWSAVVADLAPQMRINGSCTNLARAAIRYAFHDSAGYSKKTTVYAPASGGADGSLLLSGVEINRTDNAGLNDYHDTLTQKFAQYKAAGYAIGAADLIQVAGALGVVACPGGQIGQVLVGRTDTTTACPDGLLPQAFGPGSDHDTIYALFQDKGFAARDLAALIGAHSTSIANFQTAYGIPAGTSQDTTPGQWDVLYYNETLYPPASGGMMSFDSDINLSKTGTTVGKQFQAFVGAQATWGASFSSAFQTLSLLGISFSTYRKFQDCSALVGNAFA